MSEFTLPSGRAIELADEPTYGHVADALDYTANHSAQLVHYYIGLAAAMSGWTTDAIRALSPKDGGALRVEVTRREEGRPFEEEDPFETSSSPSSGATTSTGSPESSATSSS